MMGHKEKLKSGAEVDVVCTRGWYTYLAKAGVRKKVKKQMMRRNRHFAKQNMYFVIGELDGVI